MKQWNQWIRLHGMIHEIASWKNGCKNGIQNFSANSYAWPWKTTVRILIFHISNTNRSNKFPEIPVSARANDLGSRRNPAPLGMRKKTLWNSRSLWNKFTSKWLTWRSAMRLWISVLLDIIGQLPFILQTNFKFHIGYTERMAFKRYFPFKY